MLRSCCMVRFACRRMSSSVKAPSKPSGFHTIPSQQEHHELYLQFEKQVHDPDWTRITRRRAMRWFSLTDYELAELDDKAMKPNNPSDTNNRELSQYWLTDIVPLATAKHGGTEAVLQNFKVYLEKRHHSTRAEAMSGYRDTTHMTPPPVLSWREYIYNLCCKPATNPQQGLEEVSAGLRNNALILLFKFVVWLGTGSKALFADMMHSFADVLTYGYRAVGISSKRRPDMSHPYGYNLYKHLVFDRTQSYVMILGGIIPFFHGLSAFGDSHSIEYSWAVILTFLFAGWRESNTALKAYRSLQQHTMQSPYKPIGAGIEKCGVRNVLNYVIKGRPEIFTMSTALEGSLGILASAMGIIGVALSSVLGTGVFDAAASLCIASSVGLLSIWLQQRNSHILLAAALPTERVHAVNRVLELDPIVMSVLDVKTIFLGGDTVRYKCEIEINPEELTRQLPNLLAEDSIKTVLKHPEQSHTLTKEWLMRNNAHFYVALSLELKRLEGLVRAELSEYGEVHVDIELW